MSDAMDCAAARAMLPALLDGELTVRDRAAIEAHVAGCAACRAETDAAAAESRRLRGQAGAYRAPALLRARIGAALDAADHAVAAVDTAARPPRRRLGYALAAAAAIVLLLAGAAIGFLFAREPAEQRIAADITASHLRALIADKLVDVASSDKHTVKPWFNGRVDVAPPVEDMTEQGFRLAGGRVDYIAERRVAVLVYRHRQHAIDLYVWPAAAAAAPVAMARRGYNLRAWTAHGLAFWAITDLNAPDLDRFVGLARTRFGQPDAR